MIAKASHSKRPRDANLLAQLIVDLATDGNGAGNGNPLPTKDSAAVSLGRRGGLKGGKARAAKLTPQQRDDIARKAAAARYGKK